MDRRREDRLESPTIGGRHRERIELGGRNDVIGDQAIFRDAAGPTRRIEPDQAHELEEVASSYFGLSVSNIRFEELARDVETVLRGKQGTENVPGLTQQLRERSRLFFSELPTGDGRQPGGIEHDLVVRA